ncbi:MAG: hypothetical protein ACK5V8_13905 [Betaproteobacteria bacterium]
MVSSSGFSTRSGGSASRAVAALLLGFGALIAWVGARGLADGQPVAALFLLMGLGVLALGVWTWRYRPVASTGNPPVLRANDGLGIAFVGGFAVLWNAVAWPIGFALWREAGGAPGPGWAAALFPLAGLALAVLALRAWVRWRRLGRAALTLRPRQPSLGAPFDARLVFEGARAPLPRDWRVRLKCEEVVMTRGGKGNTRSRRRVLWQHEVQARGDGARVQLRLPAGDPGAAQAHAQASTGQQGDGAIHWTLEFEAQDGDGARSFSLAIDPHDPQAEPLPPLAATAAGPSAPPTAWPSVWPATGSRSGQPPPRAGPASGALRRGCTGARPGCCWQSAHCSPQSAARWPPPALPAATMATGGAAPCSRRWDRSRWRRARCC